MKNQKLEAAQRQIVRDLFFIEPTFQPELMTIHDPFRKMKPLTGLSRAFKEYNKRFFTLNLEQMILYYTSKELYTVNDIQYIPLEEITEIRDKPHYITNTHTAEYNDATGFTFYFNDRYVILIAKTKEIYQKWLQYFEAIRWKSSGQSILKRLRTQYLFPLISSEKSLKESQVTGKKEQKQQIEEKKQELKKEIDSDDKPSKQEEQQPLPQQKQTENKESVEQVQNNNEIVQKQSKLELKKDVEINKKTSQEQQKQSEQQGHIQKSKKMENNNQKTNQTISDQIVQNPMREIKQEFKVTSQKQITKLEQSKPQLKKTEDQVKYNQQQQDKQQEENIIIIGEVQQQMNEKAEENFIVPIRLDSEKPQMKTSNNQKNQNYQSSYKKSDGPRNIWQNEDENGNIIIKPTVMKSNFTQNGKKVQEKNQEEKKETQKVSLDDEEDFDEQDFMNSLLGIKRDNIAEEKELIKEKEKESEEKQEKGFFLSKNLSNHTSSYDEGNEDMLLDLDKIDSQQEQQETQIQKVEPEKQKVQNNYEDWDDDI